jgi:hypothetical protein
MEPIGIDRHPSFPSQETKSLEENNRLKKALSWNLKNTVASAHRHQMVWFEVEASSASTSM